MNKFGRGSGLEWGWGLFLQTCELVPDVVFGGFCSAGYRFVIKISK